MCCFYLCVESGGGNEHFEEENRWLIVRPLNSDVQKSSVRISKPVGEMK